MSQEKNVVPVNPGEDGSEDSSPHAALQQRSPLRRVGCAIGVILWVLVLLIPCIFITLAVRYEITVDTGSAPEQRLRLWLIMEAEQRGVGFSSTSVQESEGQTCVQTDVQFFLWQGQAEPVSFCNCYERSAEDWVSTSAQPGVCAIP